MTDNLQPLVLDLLEWVAKEARPYAELMEAWRTSCPRLPVWEEALDRGLVRRQEVEGRGLHVVVTSQGRAWLTAHRGALRSPA
jgi:hypothetical protein